MDRGGGRSGAQAWGQRASGAEQAMYQVPGMPGYVQTASGQIFMVPQLGLCE